MSFTAAAQTTFTVLSKNVVIVVIPGQRPAEDGTYRGTDSGVLKKHP